MANFLNGTGYAKRPVPKPLHDEPLAKWAARLAGWLELELGNIQRRVAGVSNRTVTTDTTVLISDGLILCDSTAGPVDVTWPTPISATEDWIVTIKRINAGADVVTVIGTVDGAVDPTLAAQYKSVTLWSDGVTLHKIASV